MQIVGSDKPEFYQAASVIKAHLPLVVVSPECQIIYDENRYYGIITPDGDNLCYDHVCLDPWYMTPQHIFMVLTTVFSIGTVLNAFVAPENSRSKRFLNGVGFTNTGTLRQADGNWEIYSMTSAEWQNNRIRRHFLQKQSQSENNTRGIA